MSSILTDRGPGFRAIIEAIAAERAAQDAKWGPQDHDNGTGENFAALADRARREVDAAAAVGTTTFAGILLEEVFEALAETDEEALRTELIQAAAVIACWIEAIDRRNLVTRRAPGRRELLRHLWPPSWRR